MHYFTIKNLKYVGILEYMRQNSKSYLIEINATKEEVMEKRKEYAIDKNNDTLYSSIAQEGYGQYFSIHIPSIVMIVKKYMLFYKLYCYATSWEFQTSLDNIHWYTLHKHESSILNNKQYNYFDVAPTLASYYRLVNRGNTGCGTDDTRFTIGEFEIYGSLINIVTYGHKQRIQFCFLFVFLFV